MTPRPGQNTCKVDADWISGPLAHDLIRGASFRCRRSCPPGCDAGADPRRSRFDPRWQYENPLGFGGPPEEVPTMSYESLSHSRWSCTYHVVFVRNAVESRCTGRSGRTWAPCFTSWRRRKSARLSRGTWCRPASIWFSTFRRSPPSRKSLDTSRGRLRSRWLGSSAGDSATSTARSFWARGYAVSTVGFEKEQVRKYVRDQEQLDGDHDHLRPTDHPAVSGPAANCHRRPRPPKPVIRS